MQNAVSAQSTQLQSSPTIRSHRPSGLWWHVPPPVPPVMNAWDDEVVSPPVPSVVPLLAPLEQPAQMERTEAREMPSQARGLRMRAPAGIVRSHEAPRQSDSLDHARTPR